MSARTTTGTYGGYQTLTQSRNPVFIPQKIQKLFVQVCLVDFDFKGVVRAGMYTKIFDLVHRDRLILRSLGSSVALGECPERANLDFTRRDRPVWVNLRLAICHSEQ
jgi:hypothetical protein